MCLKQGRSSALGVPSNHALHRLPTPHPTDQALSPPRGQGAMCASISTEDSGTGAKGTPPCILSLYNCAFVFAILCARKSLLPLVLLEIPLPPGSPPLGYTSSLHPHQNHPSHTSTAFLAPLVSPLITLPLSESCIWMLLECIQGSPVCHWERSIAGEAKEGFLPWKGGLTSASLQRTQNTV